MKENIDYELVPSGENEQLWDVRLIKGDFIETVIRFGTVSFDPDTEMLNYSFKIINTPDINLTQDNIELQNTVTGILENIIEESLEKEEDLQKTQQ